VPDICSLAETVQKSIRTVRSIQSDMDICDLSLVIEIAVNSGVVYLLEAVMLLVLDYRPCVL
jgi:hypothetical protein